MRHTVARLGEPHSESLRGGSEELVVFGVLLVGLQQVVVDVLHADLGMHLVEFQRLQLLHHQRSGGVLGQGLVDAEGNLLTRGGLA